MRCMTGEAWNELMHSLSKDQFFYETILGQRCVPDMRITAEEYAELERKGFFELDGPVQCGTPVSFVYFISYTLFVTFCILNLFIAVIFEGFDDSQKSEEGDILAACQQVWVKYDPDLKMSLDLQKSLQFIEEVYYDVSRGKKQETKTQDVAPPKLNKPTLKRSQGSKATVAGYDEFDTFGKYNLHYAMTVNMPLFRPKGKMLENRECFTTFPECVLSVSRRRITNLNLDYVNELDSLSDHDRIKFEALHRTANERCVRPLLLDKIQNRFFAEHVAAGK